jgi:hypothetical protein
MTDAATEADGRVPKLRVLLGTERFSSQHGWGELAGLMPGALQATVDVQWCLLERLPTLPATSRSMSSFRSGPSWMPKPSMPGSSA